MVQVLTANVLCLFCRDHGPRGDRQKTRLIWLIEQLGFEAFSNLVAEVSITPCSYHQLGPVDPCPAVPLRNSI